MVMVLSWAGLVIMGRVVLVVEMGSGYAIPVFDMWNHRHRTHRHLGFHLEHGSFYISGERFERR